MRTALMILLAVGGCERSSKTAPTPTPTQTPTQDGAEAPRLLVNVPREGDVVLIERDMPAPVPDDQLDTRFRAFALRDPSSWLVVIADPATTVDRVIGILDRARLAGLRDYELGIDRAHTHELRGPKAATGGDVEAVVLIAVAPAGDLHVNGESVPERELDQVLRKHAAGRAVVMSDAGVTMGRLVLVLDAANRAGIANVAIGRPVPPLEPAPP